MTASTRRLLLGLVAIALVAGGWYALSIWQGRNENQLAEGWWNAMACNRPTLAPVEVHPVSRWHKSDACEMLHDRSWAELDWAKAREFSPDVGVAIGDIQPFLIRCVQAANGTGHVECGVSARNELWVTHDACNVHENVRMPIVVLLPKPPSKVSVAIARTTNPPEPKQQ